VDGLTAQSGFKVCKAILLVVDIDESLADSFKNIREQLMEVGFPIPTSQLQIAQKQGFPSLAVLMIPHPLPATDVRGALEKSRLSKFGQGFKWRFCSLAA
jgi:hypothetical protein